MKFKMNEDSLITPCDPLDVPIFHHCSCGSQAVNERYFDTYVEPLLFFHGVTDVECDWRGDFVLDT